MNLIKSVKAKNGSSNNYPLHKIIMKSVLAKQDDNTIQLTITIPSEKVIKAREQIIEGYVKQAEVPGFRKGKAPRKLVEEKIDQQKVQEEILKNLLPQAYVEAIKEHSLKPVLNPKIQVQELGKDKDLVFTATTCEAPEVDLGDCKTNVKKITAKSKIIVPGKEPDQASLDDIIKALADSVKIKIPGILRENEVDKQLSQTLDEIKKLGLTLDQYLASTGKTVETLRQDYTQKAEQEITLEFALQKIAEVEKIVVVEKEIEEAIQKAKDEKEKKNLEANRYLLAHILRQQKTLEFLRNL